MRKLISNVIDYLRNPNAVPDEAAQSISAELQFHLDESIREGMEDGLSAHQARERALARFGDLEAAARSCTYGIAEGHVRCHRTHLAVTAALLVATGALATWLYLRPPVASDGMLLTGDIEGLVVGETSQPIEGAHVLAVVKTWPADGFRQKAHTTITRRDGTFILTDVYPEQEMYEVQIAVLAHGRVMESTYFSRQRGKLIPAQFHLSPSAPLAVRIESDNGTPVPDVEVFPFQRIARNGSEDMVYFCSAEPIVRRTDFAGQVSLPYFLPGDNATLYMRVPGGEWSTQDFAIQDSQDVIVIKMSASPDKSVLSAGVTSPEPGR